jgi:hypothetical protein
MERQKLIEGFQIENKRMYRVLENRETAKLLKVYPPLQAFINCSNRTKIKGQD